MNEKADYRNGKYEGQMNQLRQRHGLGIFIDDDLTFYVSHWNQNKINGLSLIYISHGKYIYGEWKDNQPHGLTIFRSGDTVLVGKCMNGKPVNKCLVIFEKINFACILEEVSSAWKIIRSGLLVNYETLINFIEFIEVPVPEHFFSLTKFVCHFSKNSPHIKTFPCLMNCCYFGYNNGLAIIFTSTNGLISIGSHYNEGLNQFGGFFDGIRSVEQGNFEFQGERVKYCGERPSGKIYAIFQKIHKKSLNFHNEYFDSKIKYFSYIQQLLKSQLCQITNECRKTKSMKNVNLNDSLEFQDYTEEQSFKINSIRENIYQPPSNNIVNQHWQEKINNSYEFESSILQAEEQRYFRNNKKTKRQCDQKYEYIQKSPIGIRKQKQQQIASPLTHIKKKQMEQRDSLLSKKFNLKSPADAMHQIRKKSQMSINVNLHNKQGQDLLENPISEPYTPSKLKDRMKSNNLRYINTSQATTNQCQEKKVKSPTVIKSNNIYKQMKKFEQNPSFISKQSQRSQNDSYKVPNFNYEINRQKPQQINKLISISKQFPNSQKKNCSNNASVFYNEKQKQIKLPQKSKHTPLRNNYQNREISLQQNKSTKQLNSSPKKSIVSSNLSKPFYEDIEQRRKRILKQFQDLNQSKINNASQDRLNIPLDKPVKRIDNTSQNFIFSLSKEEQSSSGHMPMTVTEKYKQFLPLKGRENLRNESLVSNILNEHRANEKNNTGNTKIKEDEEFKFKRYEESAPSSDIQIKQRSIFNNQNSKNATPGRSKKNYQYLYE